MPVPEDQSTDSQVLAPQNDASDNRVDEGQQQNITINNTISTTEAGTDIMDAQRRSFLLSHFDYLDEPQEQR